VTDATVGSTSTDLLVQDQLRREHSAKADRRAITSRAIRQVVVFAAFLISLGLLYTAYKAFGASVDHRQHKWRLIGSFLPRSDNLNMPPITDIFTSFGDTLPGESSPMAITLLGEALFTLREAAVGFIAGVITGLALAILLARSKFLERGLTPYIIASQTIPLIAIAPLVVIWGRKNIDFFPWQWQDWMSVSIIATYLTFFPVAINGLKGLQSPRPENLELMSSYAASWNATLWRLRLPASLPYLFAAFKLAAAASVIGAIVGEISAGVGGGLGRRILGQALNYTTAPERLFAAVAAASLLGIAVFLFITAVERTVLRSQGRKAIS
jgi:NitT/TauT family transport system permease protein